ncbi:MAG TPA: DUF5677 domain-containing protein [Rhodanobacter sp.]|nr:DUF5677 domain-containing protein [Rhodanobacter sp.]
MSAPHDRTNSDETSEEWSALATDAILVLEAIGGHCLGLPAGTSVWSAQGVAARVVLRANELLGATLNLINLSTPRAARTLARGLLECAFAAGALTTAPDTFVQMLKDDSNKSRRNQGKFILDRNLGNAGLNRVKLTRAIDAMDKKLELISPKRIAELGPFTSLYLQYQRLSDDSAHLTARSLEHYVSRTSEGWLSTIGAPNIADDVATLQLALQSALLTGAAVSEVLRLPNERQNAMALLLRMGDFANIKLI